MSKLTARHKWMLAIGLVVLLNLAVWLYGLSPAIDEINALEGEIEIVETELASMEQLLEQYNAIDVEALEQQLEGLNRNVPEMGLLGEFITELEATTQEIGLSLGRVTASAPREVESYWAVDISLGQLAGDYHQFFSFLEMLEQHERLLHVNTFVIGGGESFSMNMTIYAEDFELHTPFQAPGRDNPFTD